MPEFILDHGDGDGGAWFQSLDSFTKGFVEAAFFTSTGSDNEEEGLGEGSNVSQVAATARADIVATCNAWRAVPAVRALLALAYTLHNYSEEQAGCDFWFTRNGHGVGFWDRKELEGGLGDSLSNLCGWKYRNSDSAAPLFGACDMIRGDDGRIYFYGL